MVMRSNGNECWARVLLPSKKRATINQTMNAAAARHTTKKAMRPEQADSWFSKHCILTSPCSCPRNLARLATPFSLSRFCEISLEVLSLPLCRVQFEQDETCCCYHPVSFLLWNLFPRLVGVLGPTIKVRRERLAVVMEE